MSKLKVGYVPINGNPCAYVVCKIYVPEKGFASAMSIGHNERNEDSEVYFIETKED